MAENLLDHRIRNIRRRVQLDPNFGDFLLQVSFRETSPMPRGVHAGCSNRVAVFVAVEELISETYKQIQCISS